MDESVEPAKKRQKRQRKPAHGTKLAALPIGEDHHAARVYLADKLRDAIVNKRPLLRPPLASPHSSSASQKIVYIGTKTPFLSAAKRVEKLLKLSDKRLVQSATRLAQNDSRKRRRQDEELEVVAEIAEEEKRKGREEVVIKGTGKAIAKVLEIALWFQQREQEFAVRLQTSSASSIDDIEYREEGAEEGDVTEETRIRKVSVLEVYVIAR